MNYVHGDTPCLTPGQPEEGEADKCRLKAVSRRQDPDGKG